ncbi:hypothetical protein, partial [Pedobacter jeongneungensis]|uniref:TubC N-terminal docking domain-related protein n=1 Tax=Pedobacter jeongneungensis TaxID=947309 RepID=UPI0031ED3F04
MKELISRLNANNIHLSIDNGDLKLRYNNSDLSPLLLAEIKANKEGIIEYLRSNIYNLRDFESIPLVAV